MTGSHATPPRLATGRRRLLLPAALASTALLTALIGCGVDQTDGSKPLPSEAEASTLEECVTDPDRIAHDPAQNRNAAFPDETQRRFEDAAAQAFADTGAPGAVVGISNDQGTWVRAFGTAQIDIATGAGLPEGTPMERGTHVRIGSITKTFTGTVAVQLDEEGLLSLDDAIEQYWPGIAGGDRITLRHLANMTSGIPSYTIQESFQEDLFSNPTRSFTPEQLIAYALPDAPVFEPGERFDYSNTNTILLAAAIEQVTGKPIDEVVAERIFRPLGLTETSWPHDGTTLPSPYAEGITTQGLGDDSAGTVQDATHWNPSWAGAAGAIISTTDDLLVYGQALATGRHLMLSDSAEARLNSFPEEQSIGYGLGYACYSGWIGHEGSLPGYNTQLVYDPASHTTVVVAVNSDTRVGGCAAGKGMQRSGLADDRCLTPASRILLPLAELLGRPYTPSGA